MQTRARGRIARAAVLLLLCTFVVPIGAVRAGAEDPPGFAAFNANAAGHDWANAYLLALLSHYVYLEPHGATEADFLDKFGDWASPLGLSSIHYGRELVSDTEVVIGETADAVIITFRGTETLAAQELGDVMDLVLDLAIDSDDGVHWGFRQQALSVHDFVRDRIAAAGTKKVWLTGHSLGGAVATATAYLLETADDPIDVQGVVTFGAPRVFMEERFLVNPDAAAAYEALGIPTQRWVDERDPVPHIPPPVPVVLPYRHIGQLNHILPDGATCRVAFNTTEADIVDLDLILDLIAEHGLLDAFPAIVDELLGAVDIRYHDTDRYATRIHHQMPESVRALVPEPPYPPEALNDCDEPRDTTAPEITPAVTGTLGDNGWYTSNVTVSWTVTDPESDVTSTSGCGTSTVSSDTTGTTFTCSATSEGGTASESVTVKRDATAPTGIVVSPDRAPNANGWYNAAVTATWSGSDATSGIASCTQTVYAGADTATGSLAGSCTDLAGNTASGPAFTFKYDATAPQVTITSPPDGADYFTDQGVAASYACTDNLSGVDTCSGPVASGANIDTSAFGAHTFTVAATDQAGNSASASNSYSVTYSLGSGFLAPLDPPPAATVAKAGQVIPIKWQLFDAAGDVVADRTDLFEVGWSAKFACSVPSGETVETYSTAGASGLRYDAAAEQYVFNAKSAKSDAGYCRFFVVRVGTAATAALVSFVR